MDARSTNCAKSAHLGAVLFEETGRVHAICDGAADEREPVEDQRRLVGVLEEDLAGDIEEDGEEEEDSEANADLGTESQGLELGLELLNERVARELLNEAHVEVVGGCFVGGDAIKTVVEETDKEVEEEVYPR